MFATQMSISEPNGRTVLCPPVNLKVKTREKALAFVRDLNWKHRLFSTGKVFRLITLPDKK